MPVPLLWRNQPSGLTRLLNPKKSVNPPITGTLNILTLARNFPAPAKKEHSMIYSSLFKCTLPEDTNAITICHVRSTKKWFGFKKIDGAVVVRFISANCWVKCSFGTNFTNHNSTLNAVESEVHRIFGMNFSGAQKLKIISD